MKLLFIAPSAYLLGGVQDWLYMLTLGLRERGHNVVVAVPNNKHHRMDKFNEHFGGIEAVSFVNRTSTPEGRIRGLCSCLIANKADIVIGVNIGDIYEAFWRVREKLNGSRLVMTIHAIEANYFADVQDYSNLIDAVITTNRLTELMVIRSNNISSKRVYYAPYGVHVVGEYPREIGTYLRLAWVGRIENTQKRVSDLNRILIELDKLDLEFTLSIAGDGISLDDLKMDLEFWVNKERVRFFGGLRKEDMPLFYSGHDVLLITSQWETGPIVAWEAMSSGLAIVSSEYIGSRAEEALIHNKTALLYPTGKAKEAAVQIKRLEDRFLRTHISDNGRALANSRYSSKASLAAWEATFESIMNLPIKKELPKRAKLAIRANGRLESLLGTNLSEKVRLFLPSPVAASSPGSEWPHSLQGKNDQTSILRFAEEVERSSNDDRSSFI
jgi:glycosyltransferase involved in cell wall biosynthesis